MNAFLLWTAAAIFALLPAIFWLVFWYRKSPAVHTKTMVFRSFFYGAMGVVPFLGVKYMLEYSPNLQAFWEVFQGRSFFWATLLLTLLLAGLEEFLKHFGVYTHEADHMHDQRYVLIGVLCFISAGLGFAFMENVLYFKDAISIIGVEPIFWRIFIFRSFGTMLGHSLFSGIFGFLWLQAEFSGKNQRHVFKS